MRWLLAVAVTLVAARAGTADQANRIFFVQCPPGENDPAGIDTANSILALRYTSGMRIVSADARDVASSMQCMTEGFRSATDPAVDADGTRMAFAGQKDVGDPLQIWELRLNAKTTDRVAQCGADCVNPAFLPDGRVIFASLLSGEYEEHGAMRSWSLYESEPGDPTPKRLTFNPSSDFDPAVLPDGRIVYSSWQHVGNHFWPRGTTALMMINSDGTGVFPLTGNHREPWLKRGAAWLGDDRIAFIQADTFREFGAGSPVVTSTNDAFAPYSALLPPDQVEVSGLATLPDGRVLLSARPLASPGATFALYVLQGESLQLLFDDPDFHDLAPVSAAPSPPPERRISTVVADVPFGFLLVLNCYLSDRPGAERLQPGAIQRIRLIEGLPIVDRSPSRTPFASVPGRTDEPYVHPYSATGYIPSRILGEVAPASDGSLYLKVPADRPLRLQAIDHDGYSVVNERAWFWVRPNERRACIGCHENRELSPPNSVPIAARHAPTDLTQPDVWQAVSFRSDIQPVLSRSCAVAGCHAGPTPMAGLSLGDGPYTKAAEPWLSDFFSPSYAGLLARQAGKPFSVGGRRVHPGDSRQSPLLWWLYGRVLGQQYAPAPFERPLNGPHPGPRLPEAQLELFRRWIDLGALFDDEPDTGVWAERLAEAGARRASQ